MKKLNVSEKSRGVVVIAFNSQIDYVSIAIKCAKLVKCNLGLPTAIITDSDPNDIPKNIFSHIIPAENNILNNKGNNLCWRNANRYKVYALSPFEETILLDSDYFVLTDNLNKLFVGEFDYRLMHTTYSPTMIVDNRWSQTGLPYVWATVVAFNKTPRSERFFNLVGRIQKNYEYYCKLYNIHDTNFRNDYAFAMANSIQNGYNINPDQGIPWKMFSLGKKIKKLRLEQGLIKACDEQGAWVFHPQDVHIHDKDFLLTHEFDLLVRDLCQSKVVVS